MLILKVHYSYLSNKGTDSLIKFRVFPPTVLLPLFHPSSLWIVEGNKKVGNFEGHISLCAVASSSS